MVGWAVYAWEDPDAPAKLARQKPDPAEQMFDRLDRNGDNLITPDEIPEQLKLYLKLQGVKIPERISRQDFPPVYEELRKRFQKKAKPAEDKKPAADTPPRGRS